ncbi:MAG: ABC transporter substrate-binding protein [Victivallales bacterium]|nr:ABC transporter substrate-binding protein [Victivallales bacterium]
MNEVSAEMTIDMVLEILPGAMDLFKQQGLGKFENPEVRSSLGSVLKLRTALNMAGVDIDAFVDRLNNMFDAAVEAKDFALDYSAQESLSMLALLPCGMKMPFKRKFDEFAADLDESFRYLVEGNVNHELSYYPYIDTLSDDSELPDVIVSADINSFFHHKFTKRFVDTGLFQSLNTPEVNEDFKDTAYFDPDGHFTMTSANLLVIVVNRARLGDIPVPERWSDLLKPCYKNTLTMRGQEGFFCNGVLMPFYRLFGIEGVIDMAGTVSRGSHPAEMVQEIERNSPAGTPFYIMPLFFAKRLKDENTFDIIFPEEGAIVSPVIMLVRAEKVKQAAKVAEFIAGQEMAQFCADAGFPSIRPDVDNHLPAQCKLFWMGWDFLKDEDPAEVKAKIDVIFREHVLK